VGKQYLLRVRLRRFCRVSGSLRAQTGAGARRAERNRTGERPGSRLWGEKLRAQSATGVPASGPARDPRDDLRHVMSLAERILEQPLELLEGVEETLAYLAARHDLTLFTKGHPEEQRMKVDRSGLAGYFAHTAIVREKDAHAYRRLVEERGLRPQETWMIGNSPKSDINPALEAGVNAVLVPHPRTWVLEGGGVNAGADGRLLRVEKFSDLRRHF